ncbi:TPA: cation:proton antiporter [Stenotrophomonas maltophilia]|uniref:cation:proton antiporter domain-containing protein n=1 Tax=Stenotrophomonas TaxID=40323 RepID=UPI0013DB8A8B|nr:MULTISPECIES: cation:proton antiporter [Stenotrophomonas]MDH2022779.1 cation:proton antiporter [Stenotrophomonas sp. GD03680]HEL3749262.1 cation:proton antiporter [Stenotrophomonas maltophilia]HEL7732021.1 cation:proton antiporter [Stenotrophomonas maltophilia]
MFMDVQSEGRAPPMKWGWRYVAWAGLPLLAGLLLARYAGPAAPEAVARATVADEGSWARHLSSPLGLFLLQLLVLLLVAKGAGALLKRFGQPAVIGEMAAGLMMGPLVLGSLLPQLHGALFPAASLAPLGLLSQLGVLMFLLVAGAELDLAALRGRRRFAFTVSHAGIAVPFMLGVALAIWLYPQHGPQGVGFTSFALFVGISMSITAFPVLLRILADRGITHTPLGQTAIACAALGDATAWCLLALIVAAAQAGGWLPASLNLLGVVAFVVLMLGLVRPWFARQQVVAGREGRWLLGILLLSLASALVTEMLGIHALFGAFAAGVAVSSNAPLRALLMARVEPFAVTLLLPLFFAMTGLRMRADALHAGDIVLCLVVIAVATAGKLLSTFSAARSTGLPAREAWRLGALMNTRGLMELIVLNLGYELGLLGDRLFAVLVIMALVTTAMTGPLLNLIERRRT